MAQPPETQALQPLYVRITHWINAVAMLIMLGSGWEIYTASPLFAFTFPKGLTLGGWLAGGLLWHFATMWLLLANGLVYGTIGLLTGRLRHRFLPIWPREVVQDLAAAVTGRLRRDDLGRYNSVQRLLYAGILITGVVVVASGFALWKPVQLRELCSLFGGYEGARIVHFYAMATIVMFLALHLLMTVLVPRRLRAMISGR